MIKVHQVHESSSSVGLTFWQTNHILKRSIPTHSTRRRQLQQRDAQQVPHSLLPVCSVQPNLPQLRQEVLQERLGPVQEGARRQSVWHCGLVQRGLPPQTHAELGARDREESWTGEPGYQASLLQVQSSTAAASLSDLICTRQPVAHKNAVPQRLECPGVSHLRSNTAARRWLGQLHHQYGHEHFELVHKLGYADGQVMHSGNMSVCDSFESA